MQQNIWQYFFDYNITTEEFSDAKDKFGATPLDNALQFGHTECAKILENALREQKLKTNEHTWCKWYCMIR